MDIAAETKVNPPEHHRQTDVPAGVAQRLELLPSKQDVVGSNPITRSMDSAEQKRAYYRAYYRANKEKYRAKRRRYEERLRSLILEYKSRPCSDCGGTWHPLVLELDHRDADQKCFNLGDWLGRRRVGEQGLRAELEKCDVVCPTCHRIRTLKQRKLL